MPILCRLCSWQWWSKVPWTLQLSRSGWQGARKKGTRSLQIVICSEMGVGVGVELLMMGDDFTYTGQGNLYRSDIWAGIWIAGRSQLPADIGAVFLAVNLLGQRPLSVDNGRVRIKNLRDPIFPFSENTLHLKSLVSILLTPILVCSIFGGKNKRIKKK